MGWVNKLVNDLVNNPPGAWSEIVEADYQLAATCQVARNGMLLKIVARRGEMQIHQGAEERFLPLLYTRC